MARMNYPIAHLIHIDPAKAKKQILDALRSAGMHMANAAASFGCTHGTFLMWIKKLDMREAIDDLRQTAKKKGWHHDHVGGRPPGAGAKAGAKKARSAEKPVKTRSKKSTATEVPSKPKRRSKAA